VIEADVTRLNNGWTLVRHGSWEVSVAPDGLIMLPRHLQPDEVEDFVAAIARAAVVAGELPEPDQQPLLEVLKRHNPLIAVRAPGDQPPQGAVGLRPVTRAPARQPSPPRTPTG